MKTLCKVRLGEDGEIIVSPPTASTEHPIRDEFRGDDAHLCESIKALIEMSDRGSLIPHGLGGHARTLLAASYHRLKSENGAHEEKRRIPFLR
jgi:hypothetical protein